MAEAAEQTTREERPDAPVAALRARLRELTLRDEHRLVRRLDKLRRTTDPDPPTPVLRHRRRTLRQGDEEDPTVGQIDSQTAIVVDLRAHRHDRWDLDRSHHPEVTATLFDEGPSPVAQHLVTADRDPIRVSVRGTLERRHATADDRADPDRAAPVAAHPHLLSGSSPSGRSRRARTIRANSCSSGGTVANGMKQSGHSDSSSP